MGLLSDEPSFQHESRQVSPAHLLSGVGFFLPCASVSMGTAEGHLPRNTAAPCAEDDRGLGTAPPPVTNPRKSGPSTRRGNRASGAGAAAKNRQLIEHNKREFEPQRRLWRLGQSSWRGFPHQAHARLRPMGPCGPGGSVFGPRRVRADSTWPRMNRRRTPVCGAAGEPGQRREETSIATIRRKMTTWLIRQVPCCPFVEPDVGDPVIPAARVRSSAARPAGS